MEPERWHGRQRDHTRLNIWVTFAGTVLAALISGLCAIVVAAQSRPETRPPATTAVSPATTKPTTANTKPATTPTGKATADDWTGKLTVVGFAVDNGLDLDLRPPESIDNASRDADVRADPTSRTRARVGRAAFSAAKLARWEGDGTPGLDQCRDTATTQGVTSLSSVPTGAVICVRTSEGRTARLTVKKIDAADNTVTFDATVWEQP